MFFYLCSSVVGCLPGHAIRQSTGFFGGFSPHIPLRASLLAL